MVCGLDHSGSQPFNYITLIHEATHLLVSHLFMIVWEHAGLHFDTLGFFMGHGAS